MFSKPFVLALLFLFFGNPSEENRWYHKEYYQTGELKAEGWLKENVKTNYWKFYHPNGILSEQGHYRNDLRIDYWYFYDTKGRLLREGHYRKGTKADWWLFYDSKGKITHKCQLSNGKKNGYCLQYMDERLTSAEKYSNGKKIKAWYSLRSFKRENNLSDLK